MNKVLEEILRTGFVRSEGGRMPVHSHIRKEHGLFLQRCIRGAAAWRGVETGCAFGISTLFIADAMAELNPEFEHVAIDPNQFRADKWNGLGHRNVQSAGLSKNVRIMSEGSETALPKLLTQDISFQFAFVDGWHTFDHCLIDFFYIEKMLADGGIICFDDCDYPAVAKVIRYVMQYPTMEFFGAVSRSGTNLTLSEIASARCVALVKTGQDKRSWDWYEPF
jgi:predicted O-methyltransferase YrrM